MKCGCMWSEDGSHPPRAEADVMVQLIGEFQDS